MRNSWTYLSELPQNDMSRGLTLVNPVADWKIVMQKRV